MKKTQSTLQTISFYSKPLRSYQTKLGQLFEMHAREQAAKPNTVVIVTASTPSSEEDEIQYLLEDTKK